MKISSKDFQVREGNRVNLKKWPTSVDPVYKSKKQYKKLLEEHVAQLSAQQQLLYSSNRYALLLIFQAMDAAGKDGAIKHVMSSVNPQGYRDFAPYYDRIYAWKNYEHEAALLKRILALHRKSNGSSLLEVACGTGNYLRYIKDDFAVTGSDISSAMLKEARKKLPNVKLIQADMVQMKIGTEFDVVVCLFSSIGYVKTYGRLRATLCSFAAHLKRGGVVLIEPWSTISNLSVSMPHLTTYDGEDMKIAELDTSETRGNVSVLDMKFLVAEKGKKGKYFEERHELAEFDHKRFLKLMHLAGFCARFVTRGLVKGCGLYVGVKK